MVGPPSTAGQNGGNSYVYDASIPATSAMAAPGSSGIADGPDGGVTVGPASNFTSDFVYMSNANEGTVSRILIPADGGLPFEEARYFAVFPRDNHGIDEHTAWQSAQACYTVVQDAGCVDAGPKPLSCTNATVDAGCVDAGQKLNCTTNNADGGCVDAGQKPLTCTNATVDAGCVDAGQNKICFDGGSGTICYDGGPKVPVCSSATVDAGCTDAGPKPLSCTVIATDGGCLDGGPKPLACTNATVDAGCVDAGQKPPVCGSGPVNVCTNVDQLYLPDGGLNSPSRTVVDRNGNIFVVLRAPPYPGANATSPNLQAGVTKIYNISDHLDQCAIRCPNRMGWTLPDGGGYPFTEGLSLNGTTLTPNHGPIAARSYWANQYQCPGVNPNDETDPRNYDDCVAFSIPLGDPNPDPNADPSHLTAGSSFGRATVVAPNCDGVTKACDVWVGMWSGANWVQLGYAPTHGAAYDVETVVNNSGIQPYGATVDCRGILWSVGQTPAGAYGLAAITTVQVNDTDHNYTSPSAVTVLTGSSGLVNSSDCTKYGIASDAQERIWLAAGTGGAKACSFDGTVLLHDLGNNPTPALPATLTTDEMKGWRSYDFTNIKNTVGAAPGTVAFSAGRGAVSRGINLDKYGNVYMGMDTHPWSGINPGTLAIENGMGAVSFFPDGGSGTVPCGIPGAAGTACPNATLNWAYNDGDAPTTFARGGGTIGVDLDNEDRPWFGNYGGVDGGVTGMAVQLQPGNGSLGYQIATGSGVYSYSDFTGYALRHITLADSFYEQYFQACGQEPELTFWKALGWTATVPPGTDMTVQVAVVNALDTATLNAASYCTVCAGVNTAMPACTNPFNLSGCNLPLGSYLVVDVKLVPKACDIAGTAPTLFTLNPVSECAGN
jgi:hypothetical protein